MWLDRKVAAQKVNLVDGKKKKKKKKLLVLNRITDSDPDSKFLKSCHMTILNLST